MDLLDEHRQRVESRTEDAPEQRIGLRHCNAVQSTTTVPFLGAYSTAA